MRCACGSTCMVFPRSEGNCCPPTSSPTAFVHGALGPLLASGVCGVETNRMHGARCTRAGHDYVDRRHCRRSPERERGATYFVHITRALSCSRPLSLACATLSCIIACVFAFGPSGGSRRRVKRKLAAWGLMLGYRRAEGRVSYGVASLLCLCFAAPLPCLLPPQPVLTS